MYLMMHVGLLIQHKKLHLVQLILLWFREIFHSESGKFDSTLSWTHYRVLLQVKDVEARKWYEKEALREAWSVKTLQRNISSQYYYRLLQSQVKEAVIEEMHKLTAPFKNDKLEFIKNPVVVEFLGLTRDPSFNETKLESSIIYLICRNF